MVPGSMGYQNSNQLSGITYENQLLPLQNLMGSHIDVNNIQEYRVYNKLEEIFEKRGIIQQKVADMVGISSKTLSNIVSNRYNTSLDVAFRICAVIGVASDSVFYLAKSDNKGNIEK
jgi:putative transcriptional regulator